MGRYAQAARRGGTRFSPLVSALPPVPGTPVAALNGHDGNWYVDVTPQPPVPGGDGYINFYTSVDGAGGPWSLQGNAALGGGGTVLVEIDGYSGFTHVRFTVVGDGEITSGESAPSDPVALTD